MSLLDNPDLMDCENETRLNILACSLDVAEIDPEFILKVINYYRLIILLDRPYNLMKLIINIISLRIFVKEKYFTSIQPIVNFDLAIFHCNKTFLCALSHWVVKHDKDIWSGNKDHKPP